MFTVYWLGAYSARSSVPGVQVLHPNPIPFSGAPL
jgi:hypothetical protein